MGRNLCDLELGNYFLETAPKAQGIKEKTDKLNLIKIKNFLCFTGLYEESEKETHRMGENICES